jgi:hypothetical protein
MPQIVTPESCLRVDSEVSIIHLFSQLGLPVPHVVACEGGFTPNELRFAVTVPRGIPDMPCVSQVGSPKDEELGDELKNRRDEALNSIAVVQRVQRLWADERRADGGFKQKTLSQPVHCARCGER